MGRLMDEMARSYDQLRHPPPWRVVVQAGFPYAVVDARGKDVATTPSKPLADLIALIPDVCDRTQRPRTKEHDAESIPGIDTSGRRP